MAIVTREQVLTALLAYAASAALNQSSAFATVSRHIQLVPGAPTPTVETPIAQPALYLVESHEHTENPGLGIPPIRKWFVEFWIWCKNPLGATPGVPDDVTPGMSVINPLIDMIEQAIKPDNFVTNEFTLGGLVYAIRIEGTTVKVSGDVNPDGQCFAAIPLTILVP
jgi:hypothetical protein